MALCDIRRGRYVREERCSSLSSVCSSCLCVCASFSLCCLSLCWRLRVEYSHAICLSLSLPPPHNQITGTAFEGGIYHGRILLPVEYPFKPPNFMLLTPNGRFETLTKICLSITSYHAEHLATELVGEDGVDGDSSVYGDTERRRVRWD